MCLTFFDCFFCIAGVLPWWRATNTGRLDWSLLERRAPDGLCRDSRRIASVLCMSLVVQLITPQQGAGNGVFLLRATGPQGVAAPRWHGLHRIEKMASPPSRGLLRYRMQWYLFLCFIHTLCFVKPSFPIDEQVSSGAFRSVIRSSIVVLSLDSDPDLRPAVTLLVLDYN